MKKFDLYKCDVCANLIEVLKDSDNIISCCNQPMTLVTPQKSEDGKHTPVVSETKNGYKVMIGEVAEHAMNEIHYMEMIELTVDDKVYKRYLTLTDDASVYFFVAKGDVVSARAYCNIHGLFTSEQIEE